MTKPRTTVVLTTRVPRELAAAVIRQAQKRDIGVSMLLRLMCEMAFGFEAKKREVGK